MGGPPKSFHWTQAMASMLTASPLPSSTRWMGPWHLGEKTWQQRKGSDSQRWALCGYEGYEDYRGNYGVLICCHTVVFLRGIHEIARRTMAKLPWLRLTALPDGAEIALLGIRNMWIWTYRIPGHLTMRCLPRVTRGWCDM